MRTVMLDRTYIHPTVLLLNVVSSRARGRQRADRRLRALSHCTDVVNIFLITNVPDDGVDFEFIVSMIRMQLAKPSTQEYTGRGASSLGTCSG